MSRAGVSLLGLLRRCVPLRAAALPAGASTRCGSILQQSTRTAARLCGQRPCLPRSCGQLSFCTKTGAPSDDEYPPLPSYQYDYPPLPSYRSDPEPGKKDVYIVQVKGLPWTCSEQDLVDFFSECRIRDGLAGIHLTLNKMGRPTGRAFIEMEHEEDVSKALEKHRQYLGPRYVEVYEVSDHDAETMLKKAMQAPADSWVVRIRGIPYSCTKGDIVQFFSGLEIVENGITFVTDHKGRNSGAAFVQFTSQEAAEGALQRDRELIGHRYIEVFPSKMEEILSSWQGKTTSSGSAQSGSQPENMSGPPSQAKHKTGFPQSSASSLHYIHMRGLPFQVSGEDILKFFSPLVVTKILFECSPNGRLSGDAAVYFTCNQDAASAMSRDRRYIGERYIELYLNSASDSDGR